MTPAAMVCEWICGPCSEAPTIRVWFAGCNPAKPCGGHLLCRRHSRSGVSGMVRIETLDHAQDPA